MSEKQSSSLNDLTHCKCGGKMLDGGYLGLYCEKGWACPEGKVIFAQGEEFPNLRALAQGCISGRISEWPGLKSEASLVLERLAEAEAHVKACDERIVNQRAQLTVYERELKDLRAWWGLTLKRADEAESKVFELTSKLEINDAAAMKARALDNFAEVCRTRNEELQRLKEAEAAHAADRELLRNKLEAYERQLNDLMGDVIRQAEKEIKENERR